MSSSDSVAVTLAGIQPSADHISFARSAGVDSVNYLAVVRTRLDEVIYALRKISETIPANDPNVANIADVLARLA